MKYSQFYILIGQMSFVGSLLTHRVASSLLLLAMFFYWSFAGIYMMIKERDQARMELRRSLFHDTIKKILTPMKMPKERKRK